MFVEHLICARHCIRCLEYINELKVKVKILFLGTHILAEKADNKL